MPGTFINATVFPANGTGSRRFSELPRGIVLPPPELMAQAAKVRTQFPPDVYTDAYAKKILDDWTLNYYFAGLDIAYRSVPEGIEVLAVGAEEIGELVKGKTQEELLTFSIKEP